MAGTLHAAWRLLACAPGYHLAFLRLRRKYLNELVRGKRGVTPETAWLLSKALDTSPEFWLNLQATFDLAQSRPHRVIRPMGKVG
jgi:antitoxin HigA-1